MDSVYKTYKYRLYPNKTQIDKMEQILDTSCALYRQLHRFIITEYEDHEKSYSRYDKMKVVDDWRRGSAYLRETLTSRMGRYVADRLHAAYDGFFKRIKRGDNPGFPKPPQRVKYRSFGAGEWTNCKILREGLNGRVRVSNVGDVRIRFHRKIKGNPKTWEIIHKPSDKWYICFTCEVEPERLPLTRREVGIDLGINSFIATSDGQHYEGVDVLRQKLHELKIKQRQMSKKKKGSYRWKKAKLQVARIHESIANHRNWIHHNIAHELIQKYDVIYVEDLKVKNMVKNRHLALSISDAGWASFITILKNKAAEAGRIVECVDPKNTSQACSGCGQIVVKDLSVRVHRCNCGLEIDRDVNAAINVLKKGQLCKAS